MKISLKFGNKPMSKWQLLFVDLGNCLVLNKYKVMVLILKITDASLGTEKATITERLSW